MLALDRGAFEVKMNATANDVVLTPDLRFAVRGGGPLDLYLRVTRNGGYLRRAPGGCGAYAGDYGLVW